ncbi:mCG147680 [Mus musculus]|nr:mCG147680 [Mus musculus]
MRLRYTVLQSWCGARVQKKRIRSLHTKMHVGNSQVAGLWVRAKGMSGKTPLISEGRHYGSGIGSPRALFETIGP